MAQGMYIKIVGDATSYERALRKAAGDTKKFSTEVSRATRGAAAGSGLFRSFGRSIAFASGGFVAFAGATHFLRESVDAAREAAVAQRSLAAQMKASGESFQANRTRIEEVARSYSKFGFQNDEVIQSLTVLERGTGNINKALELQGLTADIARAKNIGLAAAANTVAKVFGGQETALRRAVPGLQKSAHGWDLIRQAQQKLAGQAAANTTAAERFQATLHDTQEIIGAALLPTLNKYLDQLSKWLSNTENQKQLAKTVGQVMSALKGVVEAVTGAFHALNTITGSTKETVKLLFAAFIAFKTARLLAYLSDMATQVGRIGTNAATSAGKVGRLGGAIAPFATIGFGFAAGGGEAGGKYRIMLPSGKIITATGSEPRGNTATIGGLPYAKDKDGVWKPISVVIAGSPGPVTRLVRGALALSRPGGGGGGGGGDPYTRRQRNEFFDAAIGRTLLRAQYKTLVEQVSIYKQIADKLRERIKATKDITRQKKLEDQLLSVLASEREARQQLVDQAFEIAIGRAGLTETLSDDIRELEKQNRYLKRQIQLHKNNRDLILRQIDVQGQINDLRKQQADQAKQDRQEAARRRQEALSTRLFGILGFGPGGAARIPNINQLRRQFAELMKHWKELPPRIRREAIKIRKVLQESLLPPDIRQKTREMLNAYFDELRKGAGGTPRGFTYNRPGVGGRSLAFAAAGVHVGTVNVYNTHNVGDLENQLTKRQAGRAHNRRGAR